MHIDTIIESSIIKIVGVFTYKNNDIKKFESDGYYPIPVSEFEYDHNSPIQNQENLISVDETIKFYRDTYYKEFAEMMFGKTSKSVKSYTRNKNLSINITKRNGEKIHFESCNQELFLFPNFTGIFSLSFDLANVTLGFISDLTNQLKSFSTIVDEKIELHNWITMNLLSGISLRGEKIKSDEYSGSKFKTYAIVNFNEKELNQDKVDNLLFEIGTSSMIGSIEKNDYNAPSSSYFEEIIQNKINVFNNYSGIALVDSFTVVGHSLFIADHKGKYEFIKWNTWNKIYFSIYIYNLFIRYNIFRFNAEFIDDPIKTRDEFQQFIGHHNVKVISFNFLPNIIFDSIKKSFDISDEIDFFEHRLDNLANKIQEEQEKKQAVLLGIISVLSSISAVEPVFELIKNTQIKSGLSPLGFYFLLFVVVFVIIFFIIQYMFTRQLEKMKKNIKKKLFSK